MEHGPVDWLRASIVRKQIVAVTGLAMVGFVVLHLAGNFLLFAGPAAYNRYAEGLRDLGPLLWLMRLGLFACTAVHISLTIWLTLENRRARGSAYVATNDFGNTTFAKKTMIYTGLLVFFFLFVHLADFTFAAKSGASCVVHVTGGERDLGLFGLVWMSFLKPWRVAAYVLAVSCVGLHVSHGIESFCQTLGAKPEGYMPLIRRLSVGTGILVGLGFSAIPLYVVLRQYTVGLGG